MTFLQQPIRGYLMLYPLFRPSVCQGGVLNWSSSLQITPLTFLLYTALTNPPISGPTSPSGTWPSRPDRSLCCLQQPQLRPPAFSTGTDHSVLLIQIGKISHLVRSHNSIFNLGDRIPSYKFI